MTDNVIKLHKDKGGNEPPPGPTADEILTAALGKYEDVIVIGVKADSGSCISTMGLDQAVFELSRAIHKLHCCIDRM